VETWTSQAPPLAGPPTSPTKAWPLPRSLPCLLRIPKVTIFSANFSISQSRAFKDESIGRMVLAIDFGPYAAVHCIGGEITPPPLSLFQSQEEEDRGGRGHKLLGEVFPNGAWSCCEHMQLSELQHLPFWQPKNSESIVSPQSSIGQHFATSRSRCGIGVNLLRTTRF